MYLSCDFSKPAPAVQCLSAAGTLSFFWPGRRLDPAACINRTALRRDDTVARRRAWWGYAALLESGLQVHLAFRLTGDLRYLLKSLIKDGGVSGLDSFKRGAASPATAPPLGAQPLRRPPIVLWRWRSLLRP
jgi:hypothetical protein